MYLCVCLFVPGHRHSPACCRLLVRDVTYLITYVGYAEVGLCAKNQDGPLSYFDAVYEFHQWTDEKSNSLDCTMHVQCSTVMQTD